MTSSSKNPLLPIFEAEAEKFRALAPALTGAEMSDFFDAVTKGNLSCTRAFLDKYPKLVNQPVINSAAPLIRAAYYQQLEVARVLLAKGADADTKDLSDWTALIYAARNGQLEMIDLLLEHDAVIDRKVESSGLTALMYAIFMDKTEAVRLLLERGADAGEKSVQGKTALMYAREFERPEIVALFEDQQRRRDEAAADAAAKVAAQATLEKLKTRRPKQSPFKKRPA
jgi:hypothetical protein